MDRWAQYPDMHVFHFGIYEPATLKRLMGRYATREDAVDQMLRGALLVDVHTVLKQSIRASVEGYGLKDIESFYGFERATPLPSARQAIRFVEHRLELSKTFELEEEPRQVIEGYNCDD